MEIAMDLRVLLKYLNIKKVEGPTDFPVRGLAYHSSRVQPGFIFFCLGGTRADGHEFIPQAVDAGAAAVVVEKIWISSEQQKFSSRCQNCHGGDFRRFSTISFTEAEGYRGNRHKWKTTTTHLIEAILSRTQ